MTSPLEVYGTDLLRVASGGAPSTWLRYEDGRAVVLDLPRWTGPADAADGQLLDRCSAPTLDLGCGPGRLTRALVARGLSCLGVDVAPVAVALARHRGAPVLHASAFDPLLDPTRWGTVLLADGNVGIGGRPDRLFARCRQLLTKSGRVLVEVDDPTVTTRTVRVRMESSDGGTSRWFPWAHVSAGDVATVARSAGLEAVEVWQTSARWFAELHRPDGE